MDIRYLFQRVYYYMANTEQILPTASNAEQAAEIEKMRKAVSDFIEGERKITPEFHGIAMEVICLELAKQIMKEQRGERS